MSKVDLATKIEPKGDPTSAPAPSTAPPPYPPPSERYPHAGSALNPTEEGTVQREAGWFRGLYRKLRGFMRRPRVEEEAIELRRLRTYEKTT
ncbi:hypothetical protein B0H13DRAFT_2304452 [Mycena leptocephala]|nr:hypothetical protein B0H13DRAFT_2304452 [Mycena leptocephala]